MVIVIKIYRTIIDTKYIGQSQTQKIEDRNHE